MKKRLFFLLATTILVLSVVGCNSKDLSKENETTTKIAEESSTEQSNTVNSNSNTEKESATTSVQKETPVEAPTEAPTQSTQTPTEKPTQKEEQTTTNPGYTVVVPEKPTTEAKNKWGYTASEWAAIPGDIKLYIVSGYTYEEAVKAIEEQNSQKGTCGGDASGAGNYDEEMDTGDWWIN